MRVCVLRFFHECVRLNVEGSRRATLVCLYLSFASFFKVTTIHGSRVTKRAGFRYRINVLYFVAKRTWASRSSLKSVITATASAVFQVVTFDDRDFGFDKVRHRRLSRACITREGARHARRIFKFSTIHVPFVGEVVKFTRFVHLAVERLRDLVNVFRFRFSLKLRAVGDLVVGRASVVLGRDSVLAAGVGRREQGTKTAKAAFTPRDELHASNVSIATAAEVANVGQSRSSACSVAANTSVVVRFIAANRAFVMYPYCPIDQPIVDVEKDRRINDDANERNGTNECFCVVRVGSVVLTNGRYRGQGAS